MKNNYDPTKHPEAEVKRRVKISVAMQGNTRGLGKSFNNTHKSDCSCGWCKPKGSKSGELNPNWRGGPFNPNGSGWKAARQVVWARDKTCRACGLLPYRTRRLDVHHVVARRDGGTNDPENLVGLHHGCHMKVEAGKMKIKS